MASEHMSDEEIVRSFPEEALALLSAEQRAALDSILARLAAAEKVCDLVRISLSPKLRQASEKKTHWWDVGIAVKEWEALAKP
jgi:hypothetical protein